MRWAAVLLGTGVVAAWVFLRTPSPGVAPPDPLPLQEPPIEWHHSAWADAHARKSHYRLQNYDPGMARGFDVPLCKECDGMGGQFIPESKRRKGERDMTHCAACDGSGIRSFR